MKVLNIEWSTGSMNLIVDEFFPCSVADAKIVFDLVGRWCSDETIEELKKYFDGKIKDISSEINRIEYVIIPKVGDTTKVEELKRIRYFNSLMKKYIKMLELLQKCTQRK